MSEELCKSCGHKDWEHHGECCKVIQNSTKKNGYERKYCACTRFVKQGEKDEVQT